MLSLRIVYQSHNLSTRYGVQVDSAQSTSDAANYLNHIATFNSSSQVANQSRGGIQALETPLPIVTVTNTDDILESQEVSSSSDRNATIIPKLRVANHSSRGDTPNLDTGSSTQWTISTLYNSTIPTNRSQSETPSIRPFEEPNKTSAIKDNTNADDMPLNRREMPISVVVQLSGEMGNNLHKIAFGRALQNLAKERYRMDTQLVFRRQERGGKWVFAKKDIQQCFPNLRHVDFQLGNSDEFDTRRSQQANWLGRDAFQLLQLQNGINSSHIDKGLEYLHHLVANRTDRTIMEPPNANISLPFIYSLAFVDYSLIDRYYNDFRELFTFDELACCNLVPDADESVFVSKKVQTLSFCGCMLCYPNHGSYLVYHLLLSLCQHFRNYIAELPRKWKSKGYEELSANQTANELFEHLQPGEKVAIVSRLQTLNTLAYADALKERGLEVRSISQLTGVQDFCFLLNTKRDLAGHARSTFLLWSAFLGNATTNWLYSIDSPSTRKALGDEYFLQYNWTHPELQSRVRLRLFEAHDST
jgi:hypothetical protein